MLLHQHFQNSSQLWTVRQIMQKYGISKHAIYQAIKIDPSFPVVNIGPHKNYRINRIQFEEWLYRRSRSSELMPFGIPSGEEILNSIKK